jgi:uncharacterized protein
MVAQFVLVPRHLVPALQCQAMLEDYASRDGTDYGERELSLEAKVARLAAQLASHHLAIVYDLGSETWDLVPAEQLPALGLDRADLQAGRATEHGDDGFG